jgi:hypothetical protein
MKSKWESNPCLLPIDPMKKYEESAIGTNYDVGSNQTTDSNQNNCTNTTVFNHTTNYINQTTCTSNTAEEVWSHLSILVTDNTFANHKKLVKQYFDKLNYYNLMSYV